MSSRAIRGAIRYNTFKTVTSGNYTIVNESVVIVNKTVGAATTITLPPSQAANPPQVREVIICDGKGDAGTNNITVSPAGADTINGATSLVVSTNYGRATLIDCGGGNWVVGSASGAVVPTVVAGANGTAGEVDIYASTAAKGKVAITTADNSGNTTTTLRFAAQTGARTYTVPDAGQSDTFAMLGAANAFTARQTTTDGVASGTAKVIGGLAFSNTVASTAIASTSAETVFDQNYTIPAGTLKAGTLVKIRYQGIATTGVGTDTFAHKLYIGGSGGTNLINSATAQLATNATFVGEFELICRTSGTSGTMVGCGTYKQSSAEGTMTVKDVKLASTTINTTANQAVVVTGTWNTTNANSCRLDVLRVEIY